jgi:hypothetical protein
MMKTRTIIVEVERILKVMKQVPSKEMTSVISVTTDGLQRLERVEMKRDVAVAMIEEMVIHLKKTLVL